MPPNTSLHNATLIMLFNKAKKRNQYSIYLNYIAIFCFIILGTMASMRTFHQNALIGILFGYLPYLLIVLSIPMSLYCAFLCYRYKIIQRFILNMALAFCALLTFIAAFYYYSSPTTGRVLLFVAAIAWFSLPYLLKVNIARFLDYLQDDNSINNN